MLEASKEDGISLLQKTSNQIYNTGSLPDNFLKSIIIALSKKSGVASCKNHKTMSFMSHGANLFMKTIIETILNRLRPEISDMQFGFKKSITVLGNMFKTFRWFDMKNFSVFLKHLNLRQRFTNFQKFVLQLSIICVNNNLSMLTTQ